VKVWVNANILTWLEEQPKWFNTLAMSIIPEEYIDDPKILVRIRSRNVQEIIKGRRGSIFSSVKI